VPREWLDVDDSGYLYVGADCATEEDRNKVEEWKEAACQHPGMCLAAEHISSYRGVRAFIRVVEGLGGDDYRALLVLLDGRTDDRPGDDAAALAELQRLRRVSPADLERFRVVDTEGFNRLLEELDTVDELWAIAWLRQDHFFEIVTALESVLRASAESGNPVVWG
jgi:hypothetical protein